MKPENTPLEKENNLQNSNPLFSGSMLIFWGVYFKAFLKSTFQLHQYVVIVGFQSGRVLKNEVATK